MDPVAQYRANLERLSSGQPELAALFEGLVLTNVQLGPTPSGALTGTLFDPPSQQWVPLAHLEDPWAEAEQDAKTLYNPQVRVFTLIGLGLGYFAVAFTRLLQPHQRLGIFELDPVVFKAAMHACDLAPLFEPGRVEVVLGDGASAALEQFFLRFPTADKLYLAPPMRAGYTTAVRREAYEALQNICLEMLRYHGVGLATWQQFGRHIGENDLDNLPEYLSLPGLNELDKLWEGRPALVIAAGPSLAKNLALVADPAIRPHVAVICAGPMYGLCRQLGLVPDIVTAIDFQRLTYTDQFQHLPLDARTALVYLHSVHPEVPRRWPGPRFVAKNASDTTVWMGQFTEPKADAGQVQTVAHLNLVTAFMLGARPILLVGQDLSQPRLSHHAPGARSRDTNVDEQPDAHQPMVDIYGEPVWSRHSYLSMRTVFRQLIQARPEAMVLNCTEGGLGIDGVPNQPLREALGALSLEEVLRTQCPRPLTEILAERAAAYQPQTDWPKLWEGWTALREGAQTLAATAIQVQACAAGLPPAELSLEEAHALVEPEALARVLAHPLPLEAHPAAFATFVVRRFDLVVMLSELPPAELAAHPEWVQIAQARHSQRLARVLVEEWPAVSALLARVEARLSDLAAERSSLVRAVQGWEDGLVMLRRGSARGLWHRLQHSESVSTLGWPRWALLAALCALACGQYAEAMTLAPPDAKGEALRRYAARHLAAVEESRLSDLQPYVTAPVPVPASPVVVSTETPSAVP